jgi:hypothetical protein
LGTQVIGPYVNDDIAGGAKLCHSQDVVWHYNISTFLFGKSLFSNINFPLEAILNIMSGFSSGQWGMAGVMDLITGCEMGMEGVSWVGALVGGF